MGDVLTGIQVVGGTLLFLAVCWAIGATTGGIDREGGA